MVSKLKRKVLCERTSKEKALHDTPLTCGQWTCTFTHQQHLPPTTEGCGLPDYHLSRLPVFGDSFIDIYFTYRTIHSFKVCNSKFLECSQSCATIKSINFRISPSFWKENLSVHFLVLYPSPSSRQSLTHFLSPQICLWQTVHINRILYYVVFYDGHLSLRTTHSCCSVQLLSCFRLFANPWTAASQTSLSITNSRSLLKLMSIELVMPSNHLILSSIFPIIRVFLNESVLCIRWPKYWNFNISPSNEYTGLISFKIDWLDLLAVQGTLRSLLQHHSSNTSILRHSTDLLSIQWQKYSKF